MKISVNIYAMRNYFIFFSKFVLTSRWRLGLPAMTSGQNVLNLNAMKKITNGIQYIGVDDHDLDLFESQYIVPEGMAYNSYLIHDEKTAIMDTVDARKGDEWLTNLHEALGDTKPDYLIVHHLEPDHSALIARVMQDYPALKVVGSGKAIAMLPQFFEGIDFSSRTLAVKEGETLSLGSHTLRFVMAPMVHWPEVMTSYEESEKVLFSADAFGKFGTLARCGFYGDEDADWACEGRRYYFNICGKYGLQVGMYLKKAVLLDIKMICPLHGPILRQDLAQYIDLYQTWSSYGVESEGVFVAYASIHGGTAVVAEKFAQILRDKGAMKVVVTDLARCDQAEAVEDAFRYGRLVVAACSYDAGLFPPAFEFIHHLQDKAWQNRRVGLIENGSWAPSAGRVMRPLFEAMKNVTLAEPLVTIRSRMKASDIPALEALAEAMLR